MKTRRPPVSVDRRIKSNRCTVDRGTKERWGHVGCVYEPTDVAGVLVARVAEEHILDWLLAMRRITPLQRDAALQFKADFHAAGLGAHLSGSYTPTRGSFSFFNGWDERSDEEEVAYQRWRKAMRFLSGNIGDVTVSTVCHDLWPDESRQRILVCGLKILVGVYGLRS